MIGIFYNKIVIVFFVDVIKGDNEIDLDLIRVVDIIFV